MVVDILKTILIIHSIINIIQGITTCLLYTYYLNASRQELLKLSDYLPSAQKVIIVSATIDIGPDVDVADLLGLSQVRKVSLPMDALRNQSIWIDQTMPMIGVSSEEEYGEAIAKRLQKLSAMGYPIFVLFTSRKSMIAVSDLLDHREVHHLTQEKKMCIRDSLRVLR